MVFRVLSVLLCIAIVLPLSAQPRNGRYRAHYTDGTVSVKGHFRGGEKNGKWEYYANDGKLQRREFYTKGKLRGWSRTYFDNKNVASETHYTNGLRDSLYREFDRSGHCLYSGHYVNDLKEGTWTTKASPPADYLVARRVNIRYIPFHPIYSRHRVNGQQQVIKTENYAKGLLHGPYVEYDPQRYVIRLSGQYENGKRSGQFREYSKDYTVRYERFYRNDSLVKEAEIGKRETEYELLNGVKNGEYTEWYTYDGKRMRLKGAYKNGQKDGTFSEWNREGKKWLEYTYKNGELTGPRKEFDAAGRLTMQAFFKNGLYDSLYTTYFPETGTVNEEWFCREGKFEGSYRRWYSGNAILMPDAPPPPGLMTNGRVLAEQGNFVNDLREGKFTGYYPDGTLKYTVNYKAGNLDGLYQEWYQNGKPYFEQQFKNDQPVDDLKVWQENGKVIRQKVSQQVYIPGSNTSKEAGISLDEIREQAAFICLYPARPDEEPQFPGGPEAMMAYLKHNIRYPVMEKENGIEGTVYIRFSVNEDGAIAETEVLRGVSGGPGLEKEALRVIKSMPKWLPGTAKGKRVKSSYTLPVRFVLR